MSRNESSKPVLNLDKEFNLTESKSFCILPWIHVHSSPRGNSGPCCISKSCASENGMGNTKTKSIYEIVNSPEMNKLRLDMLSNVLNEECMVCHMHEQQLARSSRQQKNKILSEFYDESIRNTNSDGSLQEFKMRYFDIRISNICNFKCRTCNSVFSSQWEQEDLKNIDNAVVFTKNNNRLLNEILHQVPNIKEAYFAGGEPLITDEHYIILEEMIRLDVAKEITLSYNTNASALKYKNKDLISLWKYFSKGVKVSASIDHYGERAEYIRHGTDWGKVESNIKILRSIPNIEFNMNTVLSVFNCLTLSDFYEYLIKNNLYNSKNRIYSIYNMISPDYLSCHILPKEYKTKSLNDLNKTKFLLMKNGFTGEKLSPIENSINWVNLYDTWDSQKELFKKEINRIDAIRNEDFKKTFPELEKLLDIE
jgi:hypothetical protein